MWYIAFLLFAEKESEDNKNFDCETCNVLFEAKNALLAYEKALLWGKEHEETISFKFVGIEDIISVQETRPSDGTELAGCYCIKENIWKNKANFIPNKRDINTIELENDKADIPLAELFTEKKIEILKKLWSND